ncbi:TIR domain-containing protein [Algoriphagus sp. A40]|uniref:TIR domain-containing protein n=1 Tax=Algoriphagus sp. A40 TaxID=1945863 RepID=UPI00098412A7|nr:TIR domain-containing protein [Algoriphagus sp. A40]OOG73091.1 hypothetical protein B0E43_14320 [Algoriphagus sp. A40]
MTIKNLEDVFVTEGVPLYTFVKPPNYNEILLDIRKVGKPVIIEGQSGTGKTTTVKKILEQLTESSEIIYLSARKAVDVEQIVKIANNSLGGFYVIDDFHRLSSELQEKLADIAKIAAEEGHDSKFPKLILIGINQIGSELIQLVPDIAKRFGIHKIESGTADVIKNLVDSGCIQLNISITNLDEIFKESKGDYWLTQILCQSICAIHDVTETQSEKSQIQYIIEDTRLKVVGKLEASYHIPVKDFCRGKRFRKSNDPYFKLLRLIGKQNSSIVDLNKLANQYEDVKGSINNIKERRLDILLESKESLSRYFYYNSDTKNFAIEDPALFYYIKHLNWDKLRDDCGFNDGERNYEFEVAISFAGENRELARKFTEKLEIFDVSVFFDELYESNLLGKALTKQFTRIFNDESKFVLCLLDAHHHDKIWPTFERETFRVRVQEEAIIPAYLDETKFLGIPEDLYGFDLKHEFSENDIDNAVIKLVERIS